MVLPGHCQVAGSVLKACESCVRPFREVMPPVGTERAISDEVMDARWILVIDTGPVNTVAMGVPPGLKP